jgi:NodT family efflux transporter outer membrane factor (OMF) lipoprotein
MLKSDASRLALPGTFTVLALSACAVGPNYRPPAAPAVDGYTAEQLPSQTASTETRGGEAQHFELGRDLPGEWWTLFGSSQVSALVSQAMGSYPDIAAQQAALREVQENVRAEAGAFLPQVQGSAGATRSAVNDSAIIPGVPTFYSNVFQSAVNVSYTFDVWGKERRAVEGLSAQAMQQSFVLEGSYLTLTSNVVSGAIQVASTREQIAATREIIDIEEKQLAVAKRRFELGIRTQADVLQQQSSLDSVRATLPPLEQQLATAEHSLAVLTGQFPKNATPVTLTLADLTLPQELPVSLPSSLVEQRPDVRAEAAALRAANAKIGVATANMLPQFTLTGTFGDEALTAAKLINPAANAWSITGGIAQPLFQGGTLRARRRAAVAAYDQAFAHYRLVVLQAFQNVADTLTALHNDAQALEAQRDALEAARASLELIQRQYQIGTTDYVSLLTAQQTYQQARLAVVRATAARYTDTVTLFQALGGGWWNRTDPGVLPHVTRVSTGHK